MSIEVRILPDDEYENFCRAEGAAHGSHIDSSEIEARRKVIEAKHILAAFDDSEIVGGFVLQPFVLTIPGATVPLIHGISGWVNPTYQRKGILEHLFASLQSGSSERGTAIGSLVSDRSGAFGPIGYGVACYRVRFEIEQRRASFARQYSDEGSNVLLDKDEALASLPLVYDQLRTRQPGMISRSEAWWRYLYEIPTSGVDAGEPFFVAHKRGSTIDGYAVYRMNHRMGGSGPEDTLFVEELISTTNEAYASLWRYCFEHDRVEHVVAFYRPIEEPLLQMLAEPRSLRQASRDHLHLRLYNVQKALETRRYAVEDRLVVEIRDMFCPWNNDRFELEGSPSGATCKSTKASADIALDVGSLASAYLGGVSIEVLNRAGLVEELTPNAVRRADLLFSWSPRPWLPWRTSGLIS